MVFTANLCSVRKPTFARPARQQKRAVVARADEVGIPMINNDIKKDQDKVSDTVKVGKSPELATKVRSWQKYWRVPGSCLLAFCHTHDVRHTPVIRTCRVAEFCRGWWTRLYVCLDRFTAFLRRFEPHKYLSTVSVNRQPVIRCAEAC